jgi:hypothetical protein
MNGVSLAAHFVRVVRRLSAQPKARAYVFISILGAFLILAGACQDTAAPHSIPTPRFYWIDYESDSLCRVHVCSYPTSQQIDDMYTVEGWLRLGPYTECGIWADALDYALYWGNVILIDQFNSRTQVGGYVDSTGTIYLKASTVANGPAGFNITLGHEAGHAAGYGAYETHYTSMQNMSMTCQPGH